MRSATASRCSAPNAASPGVSSPTRSACTTRPIGYLERGEFNPSLQLALRIARFFDVPVESVFSLDDFPRIG